MYSQCSSPSPGLRTGDKQGAQPLPGEPHSPGDHEERPRPFPGGPVTPQVHLPPGAGHLPPLAYSISEGIRNKKPAEPVFNLAKIMTQFEKQLRLWSTQNTGLGLVHSLILPTLYRQRGLDASEML